VGGIKEPGLHRVDRIRYRLQDRTWSVSVSSEMVDELEMSVSDVHDELQLLDRRETCNEEPTGRGDFESSIGAVEGKREIVHEGQFGTNVGKTKEPDFRRALLP